MSNEISKVTEVVKDVAWKLRLMRLNKTQRSLMKNDVIDSNGFLTVTGAQVFLDALWQSKPEIQKEIATKLDAMKKEERSDRKKDCDETES